MPQQNYRLGTVSNELLGELNFFHGPKVTIYTDYNMYHFTDIIILILSEIYLKVQPDSEVFMEKQLFPNCEARNRGANLFV